MPFQRPPGDQKQPFSMTLIVETANSHLYNRERANIFPNISISVFIKYNELNIRIASQKHILLYNINLPTHTYNIIESTPIIQCILLCVRIGTKRPWCPCDCWTVRTAGECKKPFSVITTHSEPRFHL